MTFKICQDLAAMFLHHNSNLALTLCVCVEDHDIHLRARKLHLAAH